MSPNAYEIRAVKGPEIQEYILRLADLRVEVFRAFPYLYQGTMEYEVKYLNTLAHSPNSLVVLALHHGEVVGASTALPLMEADSDFQRPYLDPGEYFYFGESVLRSAHRGQGLGHAFFDRREQAAREQSYSKTCFCAVVRPDNHPLKPSDYRPLDDFWKKRDYRPVEGRTCTYSWTDLSESEESSKLMQFWERELGT